MLNHSASLEIQQAFLNPYMVNLISKDTHLVFSIFQALSSSDLLILGRDHSVDEALR